MGMRLLCNALNGMEKFWAAEVELRPDRKGVKTKRTDLMCQSSGVELRPDRKGVKTQTDRAEQIQEFGLN